MYDYAMQSMAISQEYSLDTAFSKNKFWKGLCPQLQQRLFDLVLQNVMNRFEFFFYDHQYNVVPPKILVRAVITELQAEMVDSGEYIVKKGDKLENLIFIYVGVAHLFGYDTWKDEELKHKCITFKKGSWFGDYQIMTNVTSDWDLISGYDSEFNISKKPKFMPRNSILIYKIPRKRLLSILRKYPLFRSYILTRSLIRRSYF